MTEQAYGGLFPRHLGNGNESAMDGVPRDGCYRSGMISHQWEMLRTGTPEERRFVEDCRFDLQGGSTSIRHFGRGGVMASEHNGAHFERGDSTRHWAA